MTTKISLRDYVAEGLANLDNPNYVPPAVEPYAPPDPKHVPMHARFTLPARKVHKVYTIPPAGTPSVMSPEWRKTLDTFLTAVDAPIEPDIVESAVLASEDNRKHYERGLELHNVAYANVARANEIRDGLRYKEVMDTPAKAIAKLNEIPVQGKFCVPDHMAHNMQALVSKRNQREHGKRFKTSRVDGDKSFLQVWRTR